ncbi:MAG: hypothetical protein GF414_00780 [Candidatus Altiarchaeales archaeon]|nr:hypothetical protein [Candidatus Altiarchaeales archaeon]
MRVHLVNTRVEPYPEVPAGSVPDLLSGEPRKHPPLEADVEARKRLSRMPMVPLALGWRYRWCQNPEVEYSYVGVYRINPSEAGVMRNPVSEMFHGVRREVDAGGEYDEVLSRTLKAKVSSRINDNLPRGCLLDDALYVFRSDDDQFLVTDGSRGLTPVEPLSDEAFARGFHSRAFGLVASSTRTEPAFPVGEMVDRTMDLGVQPRSKANVLFMRPVGAHYPVGLAVAGAYVHVFDESLLEYYGSGPMAGRRQPELVSLTQAHVDDIQDGTGNVMCARSTAKLKSNYGIDAVVLDGLQPRPGEVENLVGLLDAGGRLLVGPPDQGLRASLCGLVEGTHQAEKLVERDSYTVYQWG